LTFCASAECPLQDTNNKDCDKCLVEDDEYCIYNECYFDKQFKKLKLELNLSEKQENKIDNIYKIYKLDMEALCAKYSKEKNQILTMIACDNPCWKDKIKNLHELKSEIRVRFICFEDDVKEILDKCQYKKFKCFKKDQKEKIKLIVKYGAVYKFPCENCKE
jgi:hypothetical protein